MSYTMVLLTLVFFLTSSHHYKPCEHYHSPFLNVALWLMKVHIMSMGILTIKSTNCVDMYNGNYNFVLISFRFNVFLILKKSTPSKFTMSMTKRILKIYICVICV
jgi:hypothetical protein